MSPISSRGRVTFGERLKQAREAAGYSQGDLAGVVGLTTRQAISAIESGRVEPKRDVIAKLAAALGCSPCWLAFGERA